MTPKQIIIDKDAFVGINIKELCDFAKNHLLLVCDTLMYECATTCESKRKDMLYRCDRLIKVGAYHCRCSVAYLQYEGKNGCAYPWFLPDLDITKEIQTGKARVENLLESFTNEEIFQTRMNVAKKIFLECSKNIKTRLDLENSDVGTAIRNLPSNVLERFKIFLEYIDSQNLHQRGVNSLPKDLIKDETKFCLSPEWISWQFIRLIYAIVWNYYHLRQKGGVPVDNTAEHDYQDMEYVLLLSRAEGLLTGDKFVKALAKAAFPEKDVFSDLDEVPEDYRCNWS